jgi:hypothetical protein
MLYLPVVFYRRALLRFYMVAEKWLFW